MLNYLGSRINGCICHVNCQFDGATMIYANLGNHDRRQIISNYPVSYLKLSHFINS